MLSQMFSVSAGLVAIAVVFYLFIPDAVMVEKKKPDVHIQGLKVSKSYVSDPYVSNGNFSITNNEADSVQITLDTVWLRLGKKRHKIEGASLFDLGKEETIAATFKLPPHSDMSLSLGFPRFAVDDTRVEIQVEVAFDVQGVTLKATSPVELVHRIPLGR